jgi:hypothetical protein
VGLFEVQVEWDSLESQLASKLLADRLTIGDFFTHDLEVVKPSRPGNELL